MRTSNGVFGLKNSFHEPHFTKLIETFRQFPGCPANEENRVRIWGYALPADKHIFMTWRNKVRLAVSWWKAIKTNEPLWHQQLTIFRKSGYNDSVKNFKPIGKIEAGNERKFQILFLELDL